MSRSTHRKGKPTVHVDAERGRAYTAGPAMAVPDTKTHGAIPPPKPGEHFWVMTAVWGIADPATAFDPGVQKHLDLENLITIEGPGCFICEDVYTAELAARPCPGEPPRDAS